MSLQNNLMNIISTYLVGEDIVKRSIKNNANQIIRSTKDIYPRDEGHFVFFYEYVYFISNGSVKVYIPYRMIRKYKNNDTQCLISISSSSYIYECFLNNSTFNDEKKILQGFNHYFN